MKIYLAGKIGKGDFRHQIIDYRIDGSDDLYGGGDCESKLQWDPIERALFGHDYVGPFFIACDHAGAHGVSTHGVGLGKGETEDLEMGACCPDLFVEHRGHVANRCLRSIESADLLVAWLEDKTAFGTLVELGFAKGMRSSGRGPVIVTASTSESLLIGGDMWFATALSDKSFVAPNAVVGVRMAIAWAEGLCL